MPDKTCPETWYLFEMDVASILNYIERCTGRSYSPVPASGQEANRWHLALRQGLRNHLHLNVGIPGIEHPVHPIEDNESALFAALLLGIPRLRVILSGEWEVAARNGLITHKQLKAHRKAMLLAMDH